MVDASSNKNSGTIQLLALGLLSLVIPGASVAADFGYGLGYSATHSDNITLANTNPKSDWINSAQAQVAWQESDLPTVTARLYSQLQYDAYARHTYGDQTYVLLNSAATWMITPQFSWTGEDYYGQVPINPFLSNTPNNLQNVNVFTTGPNWAVRIDPLNLLELGARYSNFHSDNGNNDSNQGAAFAGWQFQYSPITVLSLNYRAQHSTYTQIAGNAGYDRQDLFFRMVSRRRYAAFVTDIGNTWLNQTGAKHLTGVYARLLASRQLTETNTVSLSAQSAITDTAEQILSSGGVGLVSAGTIASTDVYRLDQLDWNFSHSRIIGMDNLHLYIDRLNYYTLSSDERITGGDFSLAFPFSVTFIGSIFGSYSHTLSYATSTVDRDGIEGAQLSYRARPNVFLGLLGQLRQRRSDSAGGSYNEARVVFSVNYYSNISLINSSSVAPSLIQRDAVERDLLFSR